MHLGPDFSPFGNDLLIEKIFLVTRETKCWTRLFSDSHDFFTFFLQHVSLTLFYLCPLRFCHDGWSGLRLNDGSDVKL